MIVKNTNEIEDLESFDAPSEGARYTIEKISNAGLGKKFFEELEILYPEGIESSELDDILWHEDEWCFSLVGLNKNGEFPHNYNYDELDENYD